jgi:dienelactone hydrolase
MNRTDITFQSGGTDCAAWLYRPDGNGPHPLVVMAHGFSGTRELRLDAYAERFCAAGLGALVFDYRHFGASAGEPRQLLSVPRQHADYHAAIAHARALDWVDPDRIAVFGTSFSGGHVIAVAARDGRIAAIVSQCPFTDSLASLPKLGPANIARATVAGIRDLLRAATGRSPHYIPAVGAPGSFAVMTEPDALPGFQALIPAQTNWENRVAARIGVLIGTYRPGRLAPNVSCPALFCLCDTDSLAPADRSARLVARAPRAEVKHYPVGHFDIYIGEPWEQAVSDQTEFLVGHLVSADTGAASAEGAGDRLEHAPDPAHH